MGYIQQSQTEQAVAALHRMSAAQAKVIRDGEQQSIPAAEVVPGDLIVIEEGDTILADAWVIEFHRASYGGGRADRRKPASPEGH